MLALLVHLSWASALTDAAEADPRNTELQVAACLEAASLSRVDEKGLMACERARAQLPEDPTVEGARAELLSKTGEAGALLVFAEPPDLAQKRGLCKSGWLEDDPSRIFAAWQDLEKYGDPSVDAAICQWHAAKHRENAAGLEAALERLEEQVEDQALLQAFRDHTRQEIREKVLTGVATVLFTGLLLGAWPLLPLFLGGLLRRRSPTWGRRLLRVGLALTLTVSLPAGMLSLVGLGMVALDPDSAALGPILALPALALVFGLAQLPWKPARRWAERWTS